MIEQGRTKAVNEGAAIWGSYYRENPDEFIEDYLHVRLKLFQKIIIIMMFWGVSFVLIACRGLGKTFISAVYCCARCILYPGTVVCIASGTRGQAINVLEKIMLELRPKSEELRAEINDKETQINGTKAQIVFHNTSVIKVVTASDNARGNRCNILLLDEFRLIPFWVYDTVLKHFLTFRRMPAYNELTEEERKAEYDKEKNLTLWLTSAFFKDHWSYTRCVDTFNAMVKGRKQFICGFPYQLSILEGLLDKEFVADDMAASDFSEIKWSMEMDALWFGSAEDAFFDFNSISKNRRIKYPMLPESVNKLIGGNQNFKIQPKQKGEIRILSADIALMSSKKNKNDATAILINQMTPTKAGKYMSNIVYVRTEEGLRTDEQALMIRKLYDEYQCDYIVLDTNGIGLGVYDALARDIVDIDNGELYPALSCYNNAEMAARCPVMGAEKVIWSIKASAQLNSDMAHLLREAFKSGRIRLLGTEYDAEDILSEVKGYNSLDVSEKGKIMLPYIQTTLLIDELTKLEYEESNGKIRLFEKQGIRKDRYSSLAYNYYVATQIEIKQSKKLNNNASVESFVIKPPSTFKGKAVAGYGRVGTKW